MRSIAKRLLKGKSHPSTGNQTPAETLATPLTEEDRLLQEKVDAYAWYHEFELAPGVKTTPDLTELRAIWRFIERCCAPVDFKKKRVLDIGCRDGLFSFMAERRGANDIIAIDNNLSRGMTELLIPRFESKVKAEELNLYDLDPKRHGKRDVVMFFGVLYHLRYPFWGLKKIVDCVAEGGTLLIESGMLEDTKQTRETELLYCPVRNSPYEATSCTFFNARGIITTMESFGFRLEAREILDEGKCKSPATNTWVSRQFLNFRHAGLGGDEIGRNVYWDETHDYHTDEVKNKRR